ncbi:MAG: DUF779 domain-containing protein [Solirubrobacteraceae bacterium]
MRDRVTATPEALETIERLRAAHGPLALFQSGGCCDGTAPMCFKEGELPAGPGDLLLGELGGVPFYVDAEQDARWGAPDLLIDVAPGAADSFSLEALEDVHFVTRTVRPVSR